MQCNCGYVFDKSATLRKRGYESFALIRDRDYKKFLRSEVKAMEADDESDRLKALARSAQWAGFVLVCPECSRLCLMLPGTWERQFYQPEAGAP